MRQYKVNKKIILLLAAVATLAVFVPQNFAHAGGCAPIPGVFDLADCFSDILNIPFYIIAWLLSFVAGLLNDFIQASVVILPAVRESWTIIRDFVNMLFILVLIVIAFGTIFDIEKYSWRSLLVPFIIAALLINFSFAIGEYVVSIGNGLSNVFLRQIVESGQDLKTRLGAGLGLQKILANPGTTIRGGPISAISAVAASQLQYNITLLFFIIFGTIALMAMLSAFFFVLIRIPIIWLLLIVSPIAWIGYTVPQLRALTWSKWWHTFISWVFFLPVYLFFLMFAFFFIAAKGNPNTPQLGPSTTLGGNALLVVNDIVFYIITLFFLVGGLWASFKVGSLASGGAGKLMGGIQTRIKKYSGYTGYKEAAKKGLKERGEEVKEKGIFGIGGEQKIRLREARVAQLFGARGETDKVRAAEIDKELGKLKQLNLTQAELSQRMATAKGIDKTAALKLKAESGWLTPADLAEVNKTMAELGGGRTLTGVSFIESLKKGKFQQMAVTTAQKEQIFDQMQDGELKKAFGLAMAESKEIMNTALAKKLLDLYAADTPEVKKKVEDAVKENIENIAKKKDDRENLLRDPAVDNKIKKLTAQVMADKKEINTWSLRERVITLTGGRDQAGNITTAEGREIDKKIKDANILFKEEGDYRKEKNIAESELLDFEQHEEVAKRIQENISNKIITSLSAEELTTPTIFNALLDGLRSSTLTQRDIERVAGKKPDRKKREQIAKLTSPTASPLAYQ